MPRDRAAAEGEIPVRILNDFAQGSEIWLTLRATKITMSRAKDLLTKGNGVTRANYLREVAAATVGSIEMDSFDEIKAPRPMHHLRYLDRQQVERDHGAQIQGNMWVCHRPRWHFISFCPDVPQRPLIHHVFERNEATCNAIQNSAMTGADEVEAMVEMVRAAILPGEVHQIAHDARAHWQALQAELSGEVQL